LGGGDKMKWYKIGAYVLAGAALLAPISCRVSVGGPEYVKGKVVKEKFEKGGFLKANVYTFSLETENELIPFKSEKHEVASGLDSLLDEGDTAELELWNRRPAGVTEIGTYAVINVNGKKVRESYREKYGDRKRR
jgi:hypothetical protein